MQTLPDILELLPHRYPILLVDRIIELDPGRRVVGMKQVTGSEWSAGFPRRAGHAGAMPHLLVVEALAQLSGALLVGLTEGDGAVMGYFMALHRVRCRGAARPGDEVRLTVTLQQLRRGVCRTRGEASVDGASIVRAELTTVIQGARSSAGGMAR